MSDREVLIGILVEGPCLTLEQLARACAVEPTWIVERVQAGHFPAMEGSADEWRFGAAALTRARRIRDLERAFDAVPELAALVADMLEEMDDLRATLRTRRIG